MRLYRIPLSSVEEALSSGTIGPDRSERHRATKLVDGRNLVVIFKQERDNQVVITVWADCSGEAMMRIQYDPEVDILTVALSNGHAQRGIEVVYGVVLALDAEDNPVCLEILDASQRYGAQIVQQYCIESAPKTP